MNLLICVNNQGYEGSLEALKLYERIEDANADEVGMVRVVDESGEDYLYSASMFRPIQLEKNIESELSGLFKKTVAA
jgi:hypothetical protein